MNSNSSNASSGVDGARTAGETPAPASPTPGPDVMGAIERLGETVDRIADERNAFKAALEKIRDSNRFWSGTVWAYNRAGTIAADALAKAHAPDTRGEATP